MQKYQDQRYEDKTYRKVGKRVAHWSRQADQISFHVGLTTAESGKQNKGTKNPSLGTMQPRTDDAFLANASPADCRNVSYSEPSAYLHL